MKGMFIRLMTLVAVIISLACGGGQNNSSNSAANSNNQTTSVNANTSPKDEANVQKAKQMIDDHLQKIVPIIEKLESAANDKDKLLKMRESVISELEPLASEEGEMYIQMSPEERFQVYEYVVSRTDTKQPADAEKNSPLIEERNNSRNYEAPLRDRFLNGLESIDVPVNRKPLTREDFNDKKDSSGVNSEVKALKIYLQDQGPRRAYCVGWIVGHRRCCANNVGNGICGGAPADCYGNRKEFSDSCPQCNWCQY